MGGGAIDSPSTSASSSHVSSQASSETEPDKGPREEPPDNGTARNGTAAETKNNEEIPSHLDYKSTTNFNGHGEKIYTKTFFYHIYRGV